MMEDGNTISADESLLLPEGVEEVEVQDTQEPVEGVLPGEAVSGEASDIGLIDGGAVLAEPVVDNDNTVTADLLTSLLEQSTELKETVQLIYDESHIPLYEVEVASLGVSDFLLLGIFLVLLAEFILKHLGGIFRCTK